MADTEQVYVVLRTHKNDALAMSSTSIHSIWPDESAAVAAQERIDRGEDTSDAAGYAYDVVAIELGEHLNPPKLWQRARS